MEPTSSAAIAENAGLMSHPSPSAPASELEALLSRVRLGDREAFAALYRQTRARLFGVVLRIQKDRALAEDILQDVYVNVWRAAASFDAARSQAMTWLVAIARNRAIDGFAAGRPTCRRRARPSRAATAKRPRASSGTAWRAKTKARPRRSHGATTRACWRAACARSRPSSASRSRSPTSTA